jgi:glutathione S-transferase
LSRLGLPDYSRTRNKPPQGRLDRGNCTEGGQGFGEVLEILGKTPFASEPGKGALDHPVFLGRRFSALDVYLAVMTRWQPRRVWFAEHRPRLYDIALRAEAGPELAQVWQRNFPV